MNPLVELQNWYTSHCNENWEHSYGIKIETLDNPGWSLTVDLVGTNLEGQQFAELKRENSDNDWHFCWVKENQFHGAGDAHKLECLIYVFLDWATSQH